MPGGRDTSEKEIERRIVHLANKMGLVTDNLEVLHVDPQHLAAGNIYEVDPKTRIITQRRRPALIHEMK
jgi:hypothetical protein